MRGAPRTAWICSADDLGRILAPSEGCRFALDVLACARKHVGLQDLDAPLGHKNDAASHSRLLSTKRVNRVSLPVRDRSGEDPNARFVPQQ